MMHKPDKVSKIIAKSEYGTITSEYFCFPKNIEDDHHHTGPFAMDFHTKIFLAVKNSTVSFH